MSTTFCLFVFLSYAQYFLWRYPDDVDTVMVRAESKDAKLCTILSIQGTQVHFCCLQLFDCFISLIKYLSADLFLPPADCFPKNTTTHSAFFILWPFFTPNTS